MGVVFQATRDRNATAENRRYRIADPYLRFWLTSLQRGIPLIERGRGYLALEGIDRSWTTWRGRAVEPLIRESLPRLLPDERWPETEAVGGWWNRQNNPEIDMVGTDREPVASAVHFVGARVCSDSSCAGAVVPLHPAPR